MYHWLFSHHTMTYFLIALKYRVLPSLVYRVAHSRPLQDKYSLIMAELVHRGVLKKKKSE